MLSNRPWHLLTIADLSRSLESGELSSLDLTRHFLDRIAHLDPALNAYRLVDEERALAQARAADRLRETGAGGRLLGIPLAVKDLFDVAGWPTSAGTHLLAEAARTADAGAVRRLREAGMVLVGKTNTVQFAYGGAGINHDQGTPRNPWHEAHHVPGGSSSGSGVAVAAGLTPAALGSDTGGSVRIPAALCGVSGLKTTVGRVSRAGVYPLSWTLDSVGPLARSVEDLGLLYDRLQGPDVDDPSTYGHPSDAAFETLKTGIGGLRLAFAESVFWDEVDPELQAAVRDCAGVFRDLGAEVSSLEFSVASLAQSLNRQGLIIAGEAWALNRGWLENHFEELDPVVAQRMVKGRDVTAEEYFRINLEMQRLRAEAVRSMTSVDALLVPTTAIPALPLDQVDASTEAYTTHNLAYLRNTAIGNVLNLCGLSVPCGLTTKGSPIGLMIYAKPFEEALALRIGHAFQTATDWHLQTPSLSHID